MRVAVYYNNNDIRLEERPVPKTCNGELLVKVIASGICGSDVMEWYRIKKAPLVLGHELSGEVVEVGQGVSKFKKGDRVFVTHHVPCNTCHYCLIGHHSACDTLRTTNFEPGGFAEYIRVPRINVDRGTFILPDEISYEEGTFIEPLACCFRGLRLSNFKAGQRVFVIGSGISGLLHIQLAKALGAGKIIATDISEYRLNAAKKFGADAIINAKPVPAGFKQGEDVPKKLKDINNGFLADLVIICTTAESAIQQGLQSVDRGGTVLFFAPANPDIKIPLPLWDIWRNEVTLTTSYAASQADIEATMELMANRRVNVKDMITHRLPLKETGKGFQLVSKAQESIKVIIEPTK
ncbi:MAG: alcohol dehydrogenase [Deltaproteobacteria bacterium GWC2_42_51]|nr:MAG: alcohol dehydrogenase [Deltaproteobacteria bacterium GWB2_42_7]OGP34120.1 MAG: alcohol dehydrogenase [Deltaproteobacteria bacterium GWC2_42_51]OGP38007.1 MAG: alcohol dehydrogenase [Deltaproteobacteria bacterium GWD2_42_10]OGP47727.1 MAG: alcohol dehydrogenase [Deltaproteobacteria bacterium GWF2_42_12]OGQ29718.1 MAG: alcohol dehydrogenase [Deltaproteobacteria bacterium RIFCSPHIGHO2_02_FULL_42_44]OGQ76687.1 MAG: alcohol dehydrogenase [Deltaproteobacteria bacterium RIFOXYA2_FULL_42_10]H